MLIDAFRPTQRELQDLARAETDPDQVARFQPICRGPLFAVMVIAAAGVAALPSLLARAVKYLFRPEHSGEA
jgi:hypothetical protein